MLGQQWVSAVQAVDQPGVEQLIQIPLIRIGLCPKSFEGLPEDHSPLVNTVEFQLKARQDISTKIWMFWMTIISICTHLTISLRTWYRSQVPKTQLIEKQLLKWWHYYLGKGCEVCQRLLPRTLIWCSTWSQSWKQNEQHFTRRANTCQPPPEQWKTPQAKVQSYPSDEPCGNIKLHR